jgi:hypothetical protein
LENDRIFGWKRIKFNWKRAEYCSGGEENIGLVESRILNWRRAEY